MSNARNMIKYAIFPRRCEICGEVVPITDRYCEPCTHNVCITGEICTKCGKMKSDCSCKKSHHKPSYDAIIAPFMYDGNIVRAIHRLKFYSRPELAKSMGHQIADLVKERYDGISFDYVTAVPLTIRRKYRRGYNQSALLAKVVAKELGVEYKPTIKKAFDTPPQRTLPAKFRRGNVFGAYDIIDSVDIEDKNILIIDDVKTTGATISNCAYVLKIYGANSVYAATLAIR